MFRKGANGPPRDLPLTAIARACDSARRYRNIDLESLLASLGTATVGPPILGNPALTWRFQEKCLGCGALLDTAGGGFRE